MQKRGLVVSVMPYFKDIGTHVGAGSGTIMLMNKAPHPNAAAIFINWLLSKDGQHHGPKPTTISAAGSTCRPTTYRHIV